MKSKVSKRISLLAMTGLLGTAMACSDNIDSEIKAEEYNEPEATYEIVDIQKESCDEEDIIEVSTIDEIQPENVLFSYAMANENTNIYSDTNTKSDKLGILFKGLALPYVSSVNDDWIEIKYDGKSAFIKSNNISVIECIDVPNEENIPYISSHEDILKYFDETRIVRANAKVNVRRGPSTDTERLDQLNKGDILPLLNVYDEWCEVLYNGESAYVFREYVDEVMDYTPKTEMVDMVYASSKTPLLDVNTNREFTSIPRHEVAEVYGKTDDCYLVYINGKLGYVSKEHINSLGDTYIIIDISSQNLKLYVDDKLIIDTEIVTGKDSTPTYRGLFDVYKRGEDINWPEFGVTVRYGLAFNRGEWIHDAKWRKKFGGNIYHENGSHGCVNIPSEIMPTIYENADIGTPVLVKK